ncbi:MAG: hypothetical protein IKD18_01780 [Clostridia bacterium]|nr:hypothetical protein [Clostridia bacterium]
MMLNHSKLMQAMELYEAELLQENQRQFRNGSVAEVSQKNNERVLHSVKRYRRRRALLRGAKHLAEGLAVAAVFCIVAYAVYIAAQGVRDPIVAGTGETETQTEMVTSETTKTESETEEPKETYAEYAKVLKRKVFSEISSSSNEKIGAAIERLFKNKDLTVGTLHRKALAEKVFEVGMEYFYLYQDMEKAELIFDCLFAVINREEYSVPELEGIDAKEAFSWRHIDSNTGVERVIDYREFMIDSMNMYFRRAANQVLVPETGISGYMLFLEKVVPFPYKDQLDSYTLNATTFTVENFPEIFEQVQAERQKNSDFWKKLKHEDIVFFGRYEQDGIAENGPEAILWKVFLNSQTDTLSLLSVYDLDIMQWTTDYTKIEANYWANSEIRAWLNGEFYQSAFTAEEREMIQLTHLVNDWEILPWPGMSEHRGSGGPDTEDYVFLFSIKEDSDTNPFYGYPRSPYAENPTPYAEAKAKQYEHLDTKTPFTWYRGGDSKGPYWDTDGMQAYGFVAPMIKLEIPVSE